MSITYSDFLSILPMATEYSRYITGICPFHSDNDPSLLVFRDGWFKCLGCGKNGTWKTLWNKLKGQPVQIMPERSTRWDTPNVDKESVEAVCYQAHEDLLQFPSLGWYLEMRGISGRIEVNQIGYWEGWYTFPVYNENYEFKGGVFRAAPHVQEATGLRYWTRGDPTIYVPDWNLARKSSYLYVVFGIIDALVLSDLRLPVATATSGKDSFQAEWLDSFRSDIIIVPDKGEDVNIKAGSVTEGTAWKLARKLGWRGSVKVLDYPDGMKDPADFYAAGRGKELLSLLGR